MYHDFTAAEAGYHECADCGVLVDVDVVDEVTIDCPAQLCREPSNHDGPCIFVPSEEDAECSYCGRAGFIEYPDA